MTAAASILAVVGMVGLFPSTSRMITEQSPLGFLPLTRGLRAGSSVETAQQPAQTGSSPSVSALSALPTSIEAAFPPMAPTEPLPLSVQVATLPENPALQTSPLTSPATASIPPTAQHPGLPLELATATPPPVVSEQPVAPQALREVVMPFKVVASLQATPMPAVITTRITSPQNGATVAQKIPVEGVIAGLQPDQHVFLCVQSQAFGRRIYPQGKVRPDSRGQWKVESIYRSSGYRYETYLVMTTNTAAAMLHAQQSRKYGMRDLPPSTERLGTSIIVMRE